MKTPKESALAPLSRRDSKFAAALTLLLGVVVGLVYGRAMAAPFIYDDANSIVTNRSIRALRPLVGDAQHPGPLSLTVANTAISGRPLVNLSFAMNYQLSGLNPAGYRLVNMALHISSAVLLGLIVRRTLRLEHFENQSHQSSGALAALIALVWAAHPLLSETVVYVTQRTELLLAFCYFGTIYCSLRYWAADSGGERSLWLVLAAVLCAAGMASKEVMVSAPVAVLLFDRAFVARSFREAWRRSWALYCALACGWIVLVGLNISAPRAATAGFHLGVPAHVWWMTQAKVTMLYLKLSVWPWPLRVHYQIPYVDSLGGAWIYLLSVVILLAATLWALWKNYALGFLGAWVGMILAPTFIVPVITEVAAERRMYLPLAALVVSLVVGLSSGARYLRSRRSPAAERSGAWRSWAEVAIPLLLLAVVLSLVTVRRLAAYESELALWQDVVAHQCDDWIAHNDVASELFKQGKIDEAFAELQLALRLNPDYAPSQSNYGNILLARGKPEEAIQYYEHAVRLDPGFVEAQNNVGMALEATGKTEQAQRQYEQALQTCPVFIEAHLNLARVLLAQGDNDGALAHYRQAKGLEPDDVRVHFDYAKALFALHRAAEAIDQYRIVLQLQPNLPSVENNLGIALTEARQFAEAVAHFRRAIELRPNDVDAHVNCGAALMLAGHPEQATEQFQRALKLKPDDAQVWFELAKSLATAGKDAEAIAAAKKSLDVARAQGETGVATAAEAWLKAHAETAPQQQ